MRLLQRITVAVFLFFISCKQAASGVKEIVVEDLRKILHKDIQLVDVRTPSECAEGIITRATQIDVTSDDFEKKALQMLDKSKPVYIYCRSGGRSGIAAEILAKKGYKVYNLTGGYMEWQEKIYKK